MDLGSRGVGEGHCHCKLIERFAQKLRKIICLTIFVLGFILETPENHMFSFFRLGGRVHESQNQLLLFLRQQTSQNNSRTNPASLFKDVIFRNINMLEIQPFETYWERRVPNNLEDPSNKFLKILNTGSISSNKT